MNTMANAYGAAYEILFVAAFTCIVVVLALLALGLSLFPGGRRAARWLSPIALVAGICFFLLAVFGSDDDRWYYMYVHSEWLAIPAFPACISLFANILARGGAAPPGRRRRALLAFVLFAPLLGIAAGGYADHLRATGPSSYEGRPLSEWVKRYDPRRRFSGLENAAADQKKAGDAIRHIGTEALPPLLEWLDKFKAQENVWAFGALAPAAVALAIPELTRRINSPPSPEEREQLAFFERTRSLTEGTRPQRFGSMWTSLFRRQRAMLALSYLGPDAVPAMKAVMSNPELAGLPPAVQCIMNMGENARPLAPLLLQNLQHQDAWVAAAAALSLGTLKDEPGLVIPALGKALDHPSPEVREAALASLRSFENLECPAVAAVLIEARKNKDQVTAVAAVLELGRLKCEPARVVAALEDSLWSPGGPWLSAVAALEHFGEPPGTSRNRSYTPPLPAFRRALSHPREEVRDHALRVLKDEPDFVIAALAKDLDDPNVKVRMWALRSLKPFGEPALPALRKALSHHDEDVRLLAEIVIQDILAHKIPPVESRP